MGNSVIKLNSLKDNHVLSMDQEYTSPEAASFAVRAHPGEVFFAEKQGVDFENRILLFRWNFVCQKCGSRQRINMPLSKSKATRVAEEFDKWALQCEMLFAIDGKWTLFDEWQVPAGRMKCDQCGHSGEVKFDWDEKIIVVSDEQISLRYYSEYAPPLIPANIGLLSDWNRRKTENCTAEMIVFDIENGHTYEFKSSDAKNRDLVLSDDIINTDDCTDITYTGSDSSVAKALAENDQAKYRLKIAFTERTKAKFPVEIKSGKLCHFIILNRYRGYPKNFYHGVPRRGDEVVDLAFRETATKIPLYYDNIDEAYRETPLPKKKRLSKIFFSKPALFFYVDALISAPFENYDIQVMIAASMEGMYMLALSQHFPRINNFLRDYIHCKGEVAAWRAISSDIEYLLRITSVWDQIDPPNKEKPSMLTGSLRSAYLSLTSIEDEVVTIPYEYTEKELSFEYRFGKYRFMLIRSMDMLERSADILKNCLREYRFEIMKNKTSIYVVMKDGVMIAAAELDIGRKKFIQAYGICNKPINKSKELRRVFSSWIIAKGLKEKLPVAPDADDTGPNRVDADAQVPF